MTNIFFKPLPMPEWLNTSLKIFSLILICLLLFFLILVLLLSLAGWIVDYDAYKIARQSLPDYQKNIEKIDYAAICKKINNQKLEETCLSKIQSADQQDSAEEKDDRICNSVPLSNFSSQTFKDSLDLHSLLSYAPDKEQTCFSEYLMCYQSLIKNPYYCGKISRHFYEVLGQDHCYTDAAFVWNDPSLCQKVRDKDNCYFRWVMRKIALDY